jgi:hypothetical protein
MKRRSGGIARPFLTSILDGEAWSASRPGERAIRQERGVTQSRSGRCGEEKYVLPLPGIEPHSLGHPDPSTSLYRLGYAGKDETSTKIITLTIRK